MAEKLLSDQLPPSTLKPKLNLWQAVLLGLGSIVGTGAFVSLGIAAGIVGPAVLLAIVLAASLAIASELNQVQLVIHATRHQATHGVYKDLTTWLRFTASWTFLVGSAASAAAAALGFAGYLLSAFGLQEPIWIAFTALIAVIALTLVAVRSKGPAASLLVGGVVLGSLLVFVTVGLCRFGATEASHWAPFFGPSAQTATQPLPALLHATALLFVAYAGYKPIPHLGEPGRPLPSVKAIGLTLILAMLLYLGVTLVAIGTVSASVLASAVDAYNAPLAVAAERLGLPGSAPILTLGAIVALLNMVFNLTRQLAWLLAAMGQRREAPRFLARLNAAGTVPQVAVIAVGTTIGGLVLIGDVQTIWSFSTFGLLMYYAITNLAALQLPAAERLYPRWLAGSSMAACLFLVFWLDWKIWMVGLGLIAIGLIWRGINEWAGDSHY